MSIRQKLRQRSLEGEKSVGLFVTCGYPEPASTREILPALVDAGVDFIELGMPFSDPVAEGTPIQKSSQRALDNGTSLRSVLEEADRFKSRHDTPLVLMGYANPIHRYGVEAFCRDARAAGVDGLILADLTLEASGMLDTPARKYGLELIYIVAPSTHDKRVKQIDERSSGFVYAVSTSALTGDPLTNRDQVQAYLERLRPLVADNPLLVGFGIDRHEVGMALSKHTDGFIVGSALIKLIERLWADSDLTDPDRREAIRRFASELKFGPHDR